MNVRQPERFFSKTVTITRPNDTTAYAVGDVVADSTTTPTSITMTNLLLNGGGNIILRNVSISKSGTNTATMGALLFSGTVTSPADNASHTAADYEKFLGRCTVVASNYGNGQSASSGIVITTNTITIIPVWGAAYTPIANEVFVFKLDFERG